MEKMASALAEEEQTRIHERLHQHMSEVMIAQELVKSQYNWHFY
uniref:TLE_N domain-containing protein n=1 Tax=Heterorhabditis bacteriophora TaxID=37862 RepID=A0A1I7XCD9_HETBA